jgi:putative nucleotidyltransferase-like protein
MHKHSQTGAHLATLSALVLCPEALADGLHYLVALDQAGTQEFLRLAHLHHVVIRALQPLQEQAEAAGCDALAQLLGMEFHKEQQRIAKALEGLDAVCVRLEAGGCPVVVMKTLDHWPDFGSDLDLVTTGDERDVLYLLKSVLKGSRCMRTLVDRLAHKRSFALPGLAEQVEMHIQRLGQVGEHTRLARRFIDRRRIVNIDGYRFNVPAPEEQIIAAALQRMYRHLFLRICDACNTARLIENESIDYALLRSVAEEAGIWPGVATHLSVVSGFINRHRGTSVKLPPAVITAARFGADAIFIRGPYFCFPMARGFTFYAHQLRHTVLSGDAPSAARLGLVPPLASIGALAYAITGSSERIW